MLHLWFDLPIARLVLVRAAIAGPKPWESIETKSRRVLVVAGNHFMGIPVIERKKFLH